MPDQNVRGSRGKRITQTFLTGAVAILPLALTVAILTWITSFVHDLAGPHSMCGRVLRSIGLSVVACDVTAYVIGLIAALAMIHLLGVALETGAVRRWGRTMEGALQQVPVLGTVYDASKQVTSIFDRTPDSKQNMTPVICYFGEGAWTPALMPTQEIVHVDGHDYRVVLIPTAPVPFGGALLCVKAEWVKPAECGFEELVGIYMSMGVTVPRCLGTKNDQAPERTATSVGVS
jgi:uncharacterized membrane protein